MAVRAHVMMTPFDSGSGAALLSATVNVFQPGTVTPVTGTLFDKNGNTLANPLTSDPTTGLVDFYMNVAQEVDLQVAKTGFTTRTYSNVPVLDDASFDLSALMTNTGDVVYASAANTPVRLAIGSANQALIVGGGSVPTWGPGAATTFTPTLTQGVAVTTSAATGRYIIIGKLAIVTFNMTASASGTAGSAIVVGGIPGAVAPQSSGGATALYVGVWGDTLSGNNRSGVAYFQTASTVQLVEDAQSGVHGSTPSIQVISGYILSGTLVYETA